MSAYTSARLDRLTLYNIFASGLATFDLLRSPQTRDAALGTRKGRGWHDTSLQRLAEDLTFRAVGTSALTAGAGGILGRRALTAHLALQMSPSAECPSEKAVSMPYSDRRQGQADVQTELVQSGDEEIDEYIETEAGLCENIGPDIGLRNILQSAKRDGACYTTLISHT